ncbi:hypothetical protein KCU77_g6706, partial [Aureobasidium melanogenum]
MPCALWNQHHPIYDRIPVRFCVSRPSRRTCSEISVLPIPESNRLGLEIRSVVSGPYTLTTHPDDFRQWCLQIQNTFQFHNVSSLLIEDCKVATWTARNDFHHFMQQSASLTFSGVELIVEGQNDYRALVEFLRFLKEWPMLAHVKFKNISIFYDHEDDDFNFGWLRTRLQMKKDKYEWHTTMEVQRGLDSLIQRFDNNVNT